MSELKPCTYDDMIDGDADTNIEYYPKSEADKVIKDLIEKNKRLANKDIIMASETIKGVFDALRHQKYKRCLAMEKLCHEKSLWWYSKGYGFEKYDKFWEKWEKRWLEIAEQFKEAK